jgi:hypothetical protein
MLEEPLVFYLIVFLISALAYFLSGKLGTTLLFSSYVFKC